MGLLSETSPVGSCLQLALPTGAQGVPKLLPRAIFQSTMFRADAVQMPQQHLAVPSDICMMHQQWQCRSSRQGTLMSRGSILTPESGKAFEAEVREGRVGGLMQAWQPWWLSLEARELQLNALGQRLVQGQPGLNHICISGLGQQWPKHDSNSSGFSVGSPLKSSRVTIYVTVHCYMHTELSVRKFSKS